MANNISDQIKDVLAAPLGELISSIGNGVADAQAALDAASLSQYLELYSEGQEGVAQQLRDIGYQPTFYSIPETEVEAQVALSIAAKNTTTSGAPQASIPSARTRMYATPLNGRMTNQFNMDVKASAKLKFKIVPVPPPAQVENAQVTPNLVEVNWSEAQQILDERNIPYTLKPAPNGKDPVITASSRVLATIPAAGTMARRGTPIEIELSNPYGTSSE